MNPDNSEAIRRLFRKGRRRLRIKENLRHYAKKDLKIAEKRFLIEWVLKERCRLPDTWQASAGDARPAGRRWSGRQKNRLERRTP